MDGLLVQHLATDPWNSSPILRCEDWWSGQPSPDLYIQSDYRGTRLALLTEKSCYRPISVRYACATEDLSRGPFRECDRELVHLILQILHSSKSVSQVSPVLIKNARLIRKELVLFERGDGKPRQRTTYEEGVLQFVRGYQQPSFVLGAVSHVSDRGAHRECESHIPAPTFASHRTSSPVIRRWAHFESTHPLHNVLAVQLITWDHFTDVIGLQFRMSPPPPGGVQMISRRKYSQLVEAQSLDPIGQTGFRGPSPKDSK
ncbi:hypothetical protein CBL_05702 [Carabus blaptoides fortunei]